MDEEFTTFGTARVMVSHVTADIASRLAEEIQQIEGVTSATLGASATGTQEEDNSPETPEDIAKYMKGADALITVTFSGEETDPASLSAMASIRELLAPYDFYIDSTVGDSQADALASEMQVILVVAAVIIVLVLLFTSRSYAEIPVLLLTFVAAALLNMGTNFIFGEISFVSNSVTVVLQLALAIDYAIIMLHRFLKAALILMLQLLFVQFFYSGAHTVILAAPTEETVGGIGAALAAGELPAHWFFFRLRGIAGRIVDVEQPFLHTAPLRRRLIDHPDITVQIFGVHTEHLLHLLFLL